MEVKSTLKVINEADIQGGVGVIPGQNMKRLIGCAEIPTDRLRVGLATYVPGSIESLHWHPIEAFYYIISGHATVRDIEGKEYEVRAGSFLYCPPGIAGSHEWEVKESLQLLAIRGTTESNKKLQFSVDKATKRSYIDLEELAKRDAISFSSHY
ncbi:MAG: cupin domain-containing protein [Betaproteobacteria bacterium]|jgi:mannose-6-phosphate isomerase-like protein (cupin superfamily)